MARPFSTELTLRQRRILDWVRAFADKHGMPPTVREIGSAFKITPRSVFDFLKTLERKGCLKRGGLGARSLIFTNRPHSSCLRCATVPVVGRIAAGQPIEAIEDPNATVTASQDLSKGGGLFALQVMGESMIEAGILDGDMVLVRKQETADEGDIVVALLEDEATLKYFHREGKRIRLQPANAAMKPIYVDADKLRIQGKVVSVQRLLD